MIPSQKKAFRSCLKCSKHFDSSGAGNRICPKCKKENNEMKRTRGRIRSYSTHFRTLGEGIPTISLPPIKHTDNEFPPCG